MDNDERRWRWDHAIDLGKWVVEELLVPLGTFLFKHWPKLLGLTVAGTMGFGAAKVVTPTCPECPVCPTELEFKEQCVFRVDAFLNWWVDMP